MIKICMCILAATIVTGCGSLWHLDYKPITQAERDAVQNMQKELLSQYVPQNLGGFDQDWEKVVREARTSAMKSCCTPRMFERRRLTNELTGRWREFDSGETIVP